MSEYRYVEIQAETRKAMLAVIGGQAHWLPKSQCRLTLNGTVEVPDWLAREKGFYRDPETAAVKADEGGPVTGVIGPVRGLPDEEYARLARARLLAPRDVRAQMPSISDCAPAPTGQPPAPGTEIPPAAGVLPVTRQVPNGIYTVCFKKGENRTIKITDGFEDKPGTRIAKFLAGPDNDSDYIGFATISATEARVWKKFLADVENKRCVIALRFLLSADDATLENCGIRYAIKSGNCYRCNRTLTVESSIHRGLGPVCAEKIGWGAPPPSVPVSKKQTLLEIAEQFNSEQDTRTPEQIWESI